MCFFDFFFSSRRRHTIFSRDWSSDVCSSDLDRILVANEVVVPAEIEWLSRATDDGLEIHCWVDSVAGVEIMSQTLDRLAPRRPRSEERRVGKESRRRATP